MGQFGSARIAFATRSVPMGGRTPFERDLGGSESAMVMAARALAARGHEVDCYVVCDSPGEVDGVNWHSLEELDRHARMKDWDAFVSLRFPDLLMRDVRAARRVLWCQDLVEQAPVEAWLGACDRLVFVSEWHKARTVARHPAIASRAEVVPNSVALDLVPGEPPLDEAPLLVHLSRPERGLPALLAGWPSIRARVPAVKLGVARYRSFHEPRGSQVEAFCRDMDRRVAETDGAFHLGHLSKPDLYCLLSRATLMVYPAEFDETSCIAAIEAQANGCPIVAVARGALPETCAPGAARLVAPGPGMRERFADAVVELLYDPALRTRMAEAGRARAAENAPDRISARWEEVLLGGLARGLPGVPAGPGAVPWPGIGEALWQAITARLFGTVRVVAVHPALPDPREELSRRGVAVVGEGGEFGLDWGGILDATDPVAWIRGIKAPHALSVVPWAAGVTGRNVPSADAIAAWFEGADEHGLTVEAHTENGIPARCWLVSWRPSAVTSSAPAPSFLRRRPRVSACLIVRDAADTLRTALTSLLPVADEFRVLDTGSRDATVEVALAFARDTGARLHLREVEWPDDFGVARNLSIAEAEGDWIVWLDADERLVGAERLRRLLQTEHFDAWAIRQHNHIFDRNTTQVEIPFRAFRNGQGYRFFGAVHEHPERALNQPIEPWCLADGVDVLHAGYLTESQRLRKLLGRNLRLLNLDYERYPGRLLTDVLYLRDCVNLSWFDKRDHGEIRPDHAGALRVALTRFEEVHLPERGRYYHLGRKYYDQGLSLLGEGVDIRVKVGGPDAEERVHRVRRPDDAIWLAASVAKDHFFQHMRSA